MLHRPLLLLLLSTVFCFHSCFNYVNLTEAESLGKGNNTIQFEGEADVIIEDVGLWGSIEVLYARGMTENYDFGITFNTNTSIGIHNKFQFYNTEKIDLAAGLDAKFLLLSEDAWEILPTFYYTHNFNKIKFLANPTFRVANNLSSGSRVRTIFTPTITVGLQYGDLPLRIGYMIGKSPIDDVNIVQGLGLSYNLNF